MYGPVVRTAPNELSYTDPSVWKTLCGHQPFPKNFMFYSASVNGERSINTAGKEQHARLRKAFAPSFSEKAIQTQKDIIERYINLLMQRLEEEARKSSENPVDIVNYLNWTTFDIIGDLAFGEPFGCLENSQYHFWVKNLFLGFKAITFLNVARNIIPFESLIYLLLPKSLVQKTIQNFDLTVEKVDRRLSSDVERPDFMSNIRTLDGKDKITKPETYSTTGFLVVAGSETTASLLSAVTYYLYMNPEVREKAVQELHQAYTSGKEINLLSVGKLRYLSAVLEEALRLYPPVPEGLPRVVPAGGREICHRWVPEGTFVQIASYAACYSEANFSAAKSFIPERWLDDDRFASDRKEASQPFSIGPQNCLGQTLAMAEMRLVLAKFLWKFEYEVCGDSLDWLRQKSYILWEKRPLNVTLKVRQ